MFIAMIDVDKINAALKNLEKLIRFTHTPPNYFPQRRTLQRTWRKWKAQRREMEKQRQQLIEEEMNRQIAEKISRYETLGKTQLRCRNCGTSFEVDAKQLAFLAKLFGTDPDVFAICPSCRSKRKVRRMVRKATKSGFSLL